MGQANSQPAAALPPRRRADTLPHEPIRLAPKVLPSLPDSPCLRSTDNGAILQSGGTISGRRPGSLLLESSRSSHGLKHPNAYRSRSAGAQGGLPELRSRERDPLHRSHTNLDMRHNDDSLNKRFGSEPDLRVEEDQKQRTNNKHFRKKYRAPPPPINDRRGGSSPDSSTGKARPEPQRKLRLFKTRNETRKTNGHAESKIPTYRNTYTDFKSLDFIDQSFERKYKSPCKDRDQHLKYPDDRDMMQSSVSLKREERLLQNKHDSKKIRTDVVSGCRAKTTKYNEQSEAWKTPLLNRNFRYSERFKKEDADVSPLRREKTFDNSLTETNREHRSPADIYNNNQKTTGGPKNNTITPLAENKPLRKSLPSLMPKNEEKDEFQSELKKATSRIRNEVVNKNHVSESKTSHLNRFSAEKTNPTKNAVQSKVKESSLRTGDTGTRQDSKITNNRRTASRTNDAKPKATTPGKPTKNIETNKNKRETKENNRPMPDRGQASGKESTPEHSPIRMRQMKGINNIEQNTIVAPAKQFYFGMIESKQPGPQEHLKDFPGLGSPIIEELNNFHLIEQKLLNYRDENEELEKFNEKFKEDCKLTMSSESAVSSEGSVTEHTAGITLWLRPTMPKKLPPASNFSPATAWRQLPNLTPFPLASSESSVSSESLGSDRSGVKLRLRPTLPAKQPSAKDFCAASAWQQLPDNDTIPSDAWALAVETKMTGGASAESSPRSDPSAGKSADSGISGDHAHSDHRLDSPNRNHNLDTAAPTWTPQQDLGDSSSEGAGGAGGPPLPTSGLPTYSPGAQPFNLSLPRDHHDKGKQLQYGFNSLQKLRRSVSGALGAALGSRRFDLDHEPMLEEPEQNWFLTKSAPNSLSNPLLFHSSNTNGIDDDLKQELDAIAKEALPGSWRGGSSYVSWGGHLMYLPPAPSAPLGGGSAPAQPLSMLGPLDRPVRSKSSGCLEAAARAARAAMAGEMRERERSASPGAVRALPAAVRPTTTTTTTTTTAARTTNTRNKSSSGGRSKRFTFQSTVRQLERRRLAERLSKEADLKEQQRKTELEAMRRVEEEFQRKRAREKANIRQQLRLVSSGSTSLPTNTKWRDEPDGSCRESPGAERARDRALNGNQSSDTSARSKSTTPIRSVELSARVYRDWAAAPAPAHAHPPACATITRAHGVEAEAFSGSPRSDNYRLEFARGRSPRTPRAPRLLPTPGSPSSSGSELSLRAVRVRERGGANAATTRATLTIR